jgi:hypothetical protein
MRLFALLLLLEIVALIHYKLLKQDEYLHLVPFRVEMCLVWRQLQEKRLNLLSLLPQARSKIHDKFLAVKGGEGPNGV